MLMLPTLGQVLIEDFQLQVLSLQPLLTTCHFQLVPINQDDLNSHRHVGPASTLGPKHPTIFER